MNGVNHYDQDSQLNDKIYRVWKQATIKTCSGKAAYLLDIFWRRRHQVCLALLPPRAIFFLRPHGIDEKRSARIEEKD